MDYYTLSTRMQKALSEGNSQNVDFADWLTYATEPAGDGIYSAAEGQQDALQQVIVVPYAAGSPDGEFLMRLYGLWDHGQKFDTANLIWIQLLLAEVRVKLGSQGGLENRLVKAGEFFAQEIELTSGSLGSGGLLSSPVPGGIAWFKCDLQGCRKYKFDFAQGDGQPVALGNALWANTSAF